MTAEAKPIQPFDPFEPPARPVVEKPAPAARLVDETVIHDLRNPLTSILGNMRLIDEMLGSTLDERMRQRLLASIQSGEELNAMLGDLQQLLWLESGEFNQSMGMATIGDLVRHLGTFGQERATVAGRTLEILSSVDDAIIEGYIPQLQRALELLLTVGLRLGKEGPVRLEIQSTGPSQQIAFTVRYSGMRIPPGLGPTLFGLESATLQRDYGLRVDRSRGLMLVSAVGSLHGGEAGYTGTEDGGVFHLVIDRKAAPLRDRELS